MKLSAPQRLMRDDGLPARLFLTPEQRAKAWAGRVLTHVPFIATSATRDESAETAAFRAQVEEQRRLKSLAGIARMKTRFAAKAIDYSKMRWDARRAKFVPLEGTRHVSAPDQGLPGPVHRPAQAKPTPAVRRNPVAQGVEASRQDWSRVTKETARALGELNSVWDDKYAKLSGGLLVMTVTNRLKGLIKRGGTVKWQ